jgi:hypothetical protein
MNKFCYLLISCLFGFILICCNTDNVQVIGTTHPQTVEAIKFNGSTDYVALPSSAFLTSFTNRITIEAWIKLEAILGENIISSGNENEYAFSVYPSGKLGVTMVEVNPQLNHAFIGKTSLTTGKWYHVAVSYDGSTEILYVNGILDTAFTTSGNVSTNQYTKHITIGAYTWNDGANNIYHSTFIDGTIDELRIWNITRSQTQLQTYMNQELSGSEIGLVGYWNMNGNVQDKTANGNNGTIYGNPTFVTTTR